jgi:hypothetical protein
MLDTINMIDNARMSANIAGDSKLKQVERKLSFDNMLADKINEKEEKNSDPVKPSAGKKPVDKNGIYFYSKNAQRNEGDCTERRMAERRFCRGDIQGYAL